MIWLFIIIISIGLIILLVKQIYQLKTNIEELKENAIKEALYRLDLESKIIKLKEKNNDNTRNKKKV